MIDSNTLLRVHFTIIHVNDDVVADIMKDLHRESKIDEDGELVLDRLIT